MKRRDIIKTGLISTSLGLAGTARAATTTSLPQTPRDAEGPFYPRANRGHDTPDLLRDMTTPRGKILHFAGRVVGTDGSPQPWRIVDMWHTDPLGRYLHPHDSTPGERFADFGYFGKSDTDVEGKFKFRTYIPGSYGGRPAHIHYIVWNGKRRDLTSQIYFRGLAEGTGPIVKSTRHDLRKADLIKRADGSFDIDFRIVI